MSPAQLARGAVLIGLLALSGCGLFSSSPSKPTQACPAAVILRPLANTAVFGVGTETRPENVAFYGLLSEVDRTCEFTGDAVQVSLDVIVVGQRGPAAHNNTVDFAYFVAVAGPNQQIISKRTFPVRIVFEPDQVRAGVTDHIVETIPLAGRRSSDITVLAGFQQNAQVVDFYKHFRGR